MPYGLDWSAGPPAGSWLLPGSEWRKFRAAARRAGPRGAGGRYPRAVRRAGAEYFRRRRAAGASVAVSLGRSAFVPQTLLAWAAAEPETQVCPRSCP